MIEQRNEVCRQWSLEVEATIAGRSRTSELGQQGCVPGLDYLQAVINCVDVVLSIQVIAGRDIVGVRQQSPLTQELKCAVV